MEKITLRSRSGADGILHLDVPVSMKETDLEVTVTVSPIQSSPSGKGYPPGFFEQTYGSCSDDPIGIDDEGIIQEQEITL